MDNQSLGPVPPSQRRSAITMGLLWLTMVTSFPAVIAGFEWYRQGISLGQLIVCAIVSLLILLLYSVPACELGARSGLGYCVMGKIVFGRWGGVFLTANLIWLFVAWYGLTADLMAQAVSNLFHLRLSVMWLSVICALLMSANNFFGFRGIANFARFMAAPVLIVWVGYVFIKAIGHYSVSPISHLPHVSNMYALGLTSSFIIGFAVWGNEQDYWRFSKPGVWRSAIPLVVSIVIGQIIFPLAGWLIARTSGIIDYGDTIAFMSNYCFGSIALVGLLILTADYFSTNDSSLFGCAAAIESFWTLKHSVSVGIFAIAGAVVAAWLSLTDMAQALTNMVSLNCIILPVPTIIMITEWYLRQKVFHLPFQFESTSKLAELPAIHSQALIALLSGLMVGIATSGLIPAFEFCHFGICSLQAWLTSIIVYVPVRIWEYIRFKRACLYSEYFLPPGLSIIDILDFSWRKNDQKKL